MNHTVKHPKHSRGDILWKPQTRLAYCEHQHEVIAHEVGVALKRSFKCNRPEAA